MRRVEQGIVVVRRAVLPKHASNHLLHLNRRAHTLIDIGEIASWVIPPLLQREIENYVLIVAYGELVEVAFSLGEQIHLFGLVPIDKAQIRIDRHRLWINAFLLDQVVLISTQN